MDTRGITRYGRSRRAATAVASGVLLLGALLASCGGGGGNSGPPNPVPAITSISPTNAPAGSGAFTLTVNGTNFISSSVVQWNSISRVTTYVSSTKLTAAILTSDIASPGTATVTVSNPSPGGGTSAGATFTINSPGPTIISLSPSSAAATGPSFTLTVNGANFVSGATVNWNGSARATTFVDTNTLTASILAADISSAGTDQVTVTNPAGGATSPAATFTVTVYTAVAVATTLLPASEGTKNYYFVLAASGGAPPYSWINSSGSPPGGVTLASTGLLSGVITGTTSTFTVQVTDSGSSPTMASKSLTLSVLTGPLASNDNCPTNPTAISNGTIRASISPYADIDVYSFTLTQTVTDLSIETFAQRLDITTVNGLFSNLSQRFDFLDTVTELLDSGCNVLGENDDIFLPTATSGGTHIQDSLIVVSSTPFPQVPVPCDPNTSTISCADVTPPTSLPAGTYYIRVRDFRGDGHPDFVYDLQLTGAK